MGHLVLTCDHFVKVYINVCTLPPKKTNKHELTFTKLSSILKDCAAVPILRTVQVAFDHTPDLHTEILATPFPFRPCTFVHS